MEHVIVHLLSQLFRWLNRRTQKPLSQIIPSSHMLYADPGRTLREQPIHIGPWRKWGSVLAVTLLGSIVVGVAGIMGIRAPMPPGFQRFRVTLLLGTCLGGPLIIGLISRRIIYARAGEALLHADGVVLFSRDEKVFCPWQIFDTPGIPVRVGRDRVLVPVAGERSGQIIIEKDGVLDEGRQIQTRLLQSKPGNEVALLGLYEVDIVELASLFLLLGRSLGRGAPGHRGAAPAVLPADDDPAEIGWLEKNGWVRVRLTRLRFPHLCSACGQATTDRQELRAQPSFNLNWDSDPENFATLHVPVCAPCQRLGIRRGRKHLALGCATAVLLFIGLVFLGGALVAKNFPAPVVLLVWLVGAIVAAIFAVRGSSLRRRSRSPAEVRRYFPREGTLSLRFRHRGYAELLLQSGLTNTEAPPVV